MPGRVVPTFSALDRSVQTLTLDAVQYRLVLTWRERCRGWYLDLYLLDGTAIVTGRRLSPGFPIVVGPVVENAPPGYLFVRGADGYARADLGVSLFLIYYDLAEIADTPRATPTEPALVFAPG